MAMVGKDCVAIACDLRLGLQALTVSNNFPKIFPYGSQVHLGLTGLATDVQTVSELFRYKHNMYRLREERDISPQTFANLVSSSLYERRFGPWFVSPVVAGINGTTGKPFICGYVHSKATAYHSMDQQTNHIPTASTASAASTSLRTSSSLAPRQTSSSVPAKASGSPISSPKTSSKPSHKPSSTPWTETPFQAGEHTCTSSRRTRSPRGC